MHILQRYDGSNADKLVQEFGISRADLRNRQEAPQGAEKDQMTLFDPAE
ncbi:hypothetical protein P4132_30300 [Pseudomonas aeruginosa]|nr:hypothetical protein [Pseudomonas aeruginosa]